MPHSFVIFGASGDLTSRKLIPALYSMHKKGRLPPETNVIGFSRSHFEHDAWRRSLAETTAQLFFGIRMQCCKCHNHPFERWTQDDYYSLAAFFSNPTRARG